MSISGYVHPQHQLHQFLENREAGATQVLNPLIIGPQYLLSRHGKETVPLFAFAAASDDQLLPFNYSNSAGVSTALPSGYIPDLTFTRVFGTDLEALMSNILSGDADTVTVRSAAESNVLVMGNSKVFAGTGTKATKLVGRSVAVGDIAIVSDGTKSYKRVVTALRGSDVAATFGQNGAHTDTLVGSGPYNPATLGASVAACTSAPAGMDTGTVLTVNNPDDFKGTLAGAYFENAMGDEFTLTVTVGGAVTVAAVAVTSRSGLYSGTLTSTNSSGDFLFTDGTTDGTTMAGLIVKLESTVTGASLVVGQVFKFTCKSVYTQLTNTNTTGQVIVDLKSGVTAYQGAVDTTIIIEVITGTFHATTPTATGAVVRVTDTAGLYGSTDVTVTDGTAFDLGTSGLQFEFQVALTSPPQNGVRKGDVYFVHCEAASESTVAFNKVVLDGPAVDTTTFLTFTTAVNVDFRLKYTGEILATDAADDVAWTAASGGVTIQEGLSLFVTGRTAGSEWCPFVTDIGTLALYHRALVPPVTGEGLVVVTSPDDVTALLGISDIDNDLAFGASEMIRATGGLVTAYVLRTAGITLADFQAALKKVENTRQVYALAPMTENFEVALALASHCSSLSGPTKKRFRRCYIGTDSPGAYAALAEYDDDVIHCTIGDYAGSNKLVTITTAGVDLTTLDLDAGDFVRLPVLEEDHVFVTVLSPTELILETGRSMPIGVAAVCEIWRSDTPESQADFVRNRSRALSNRRAANVWVENGKREIDGVLTVIPNRFNAAHVVGLRCALLPQQGLSRTEVSSISDAASMFLRYTSEQLDEIAADGTFIITQDAESGAIFIRHQLTTETDEGALAWEDNVGVIVDFISFKVDAIVEKYIGKRNVTQQTLIDMRNELADMLNAETQTDYGLDIGPALIRYENLSIIPNATLKDRVKILMKLIIPLPFNLGETYITADQDVNLGAVPVT